MPRHLLLRSFAISPRLASTRFSSSLSLPRPPTLPGAQAYAQNAQKMRRERRAAQAAAFARPATPPRRRQARDEMLEQHVDADMPLYLIRPASDGKRWIRLPRRCFARVHRFTTPHFAAFPSLPRSSLFFDSFLIPYRHARLAIASVFRRLVFCHRRRFRF